MREPAHGLGEWPRAIARRGRAFTGPQDFGPLGRCTHIGVGARRDRFSTIAKRGGRCLREPAHGLGEWPRAIARRGRAFTGPQDFGPLGRCMHIGVGARTDRFSTIAKRGRRCLRKPAHGLRVAESDRAAGQGVYRTLGFGPLGRCMHIGVGARRDRFSTIDKTEVRLCRLPRAGGERDGERRCTGAGGSQTSEIR